MTNISKSAYEEFADRCIKKYGFCNWQCEEAWNAALRFAFEQRKPSAYANSFGEVYEHEDEDFNRQLYSSPLE